MTVLQRQLPLLRSFNPSGSDQKTQPVFGHVFVNHSASLGSKHHKCVFCEKTKGLLRSMVLPQSSCSGLRETLMLCKHHVKLPQQKP